MLLPLLIATVFVSCFFALVPATLFVVNLRRYRVPCQGTPAPAFVSVLVPARNEESNITACLESVLASHSVALELLVLDDASTDRTAGIVTDFAARDPRVQLVQTQTLPPGWNGKQRACWLLAQHATSTERPHHHLLFLDADVRLTPDALGRCLAQLQASHLSLLSGFPRQVTIGWMEQLLLPLIHFVLLSFLPLGKMRKSTQPAYSAGCGQFFLAERTAYLSSGGHAAIRETRHDGLRLPESFRRHGLRTDIVDLTALASVRMYDSPRAVWMGLAKNATEGIATPLRIVPFTVLLLLGQVLPTVLFAAMCTLLVEFAAAGAAFDQPLPAAALCLAVTLAFVASYLPRLLAAARFRQPVRSALLHPVGITLLLCVQWYALVRQLAGSPVAWRARSYSSDTGEEVL